MQITNHVALNNMRLMLLKRSIFCFFLPCQDYPASICFLRREKFEPFGSGARSQNNHETDSSRTFLKAHTILSNPFLPCSIDGNRKLSSTTARVSRQRLDENQGGFHPRYLSLACFLPPLRTDLPVSPVRSNISLLSSSLKIPGLSGCISFGLTGFVRIGQQSRIQTISERIHIIRA